VPTAIILAFSNNNIETMELIMSTKTLFCEVSRAIQNNDNTPVLIQQYQVQQRKGVSKKSNFRTLFRTIGYPEAVAEAKRIYNKEPWLDVKITSRIYSITPILKGENTNPTVFLKARN
jgi:hypothetical protein